MKTAIVILNYNTVELLEKFLPKVIATSATFADIIVADNASKDGSAEYVKKNFPNVQVLTSTVNYGFAGGYNYFLQQTNYEFVLLLNTDVEVTDNWLQPMLNKMESDESIAAIQPKIKYYHDKEAFEFAGAAGGYIDYLGFPFCRGRVFETMENDNHQYDDSCEIFWATGACMLVRKKVFDELGGFDPDFFAHMEEIDLCWRMQNAGYKIYYEGSSTVYHMGGGTLSTGNPRKTHLNFRNNLLMLHKNLPKKSLNRILLFKMVLDGVAAMMFLFRNGIPHFMAVVNAHMYFYKNIENRKAIRAKTQAQIKLHNTNNIFQKSVVMQYYIGGKKLFSKLVR